MRLTFRVIYSDGESSVLSVQVPDRPNVEVVRIENDEGAVIDVLGLRPKIHEAAKRLSKIIKEEMEGLDNDNNNKF